MNRRQFLQGSLAATIGSTRPAHTRRAPRVLLRSSWQTVNIGDIGHTPGVLRLLKAHFPEAELRLWAGDTRNGVKEMLQARFPRVPIAQDAADIQRAIQECDFLLHGSGPSLVAARHVKLWRNKTNKPYGVFGITLPQIDDAVRDHLTNAAFVFFRDSVSLEFARHEGVRCPIMEFGPDGAFAVDVRNDQAAKAFLAASGIEQGKFLCCIPRYRYTPYWRIKDAPFDRKKHNRNEEMKEHDHAPLRAAIAAVVRQTDMKVLLCPEDKTQMAIGKEMLLDKLPDDVKRRVVWRDRYWLTDEAVSTYVRSAGLFGLEMHSPIMCIGNGVPAIVGRFAEQTSKGIMWRDIGLDEWLFDMDQPGQIERLVPTVLSLVTDPDAARAKAAKARQKVGRLQEGMVRRLRSVLA
ncbi:MAG: polysaccharide pyruvyl transferase family protein [Phycisphaerae bacterium]|nr:polysaccharide pyruvyl transferase family protein [Phycisphaerae bacterium]